MLLSDSWPLCLRAATASSSVSRRSVTFLSRSSCTLSFTLTGWLWGDPYLSLSSPYQVGGSLGAVASVRAASSALSPGLRRLDDARVARRLSSPDDMSDPPALGCRTPCGSGGMAGIATGSTGLDPPSPATGTGVTGITSGPPLDRRCCAALPPSSWPPVGLESIEEPVSSDISVSLPYPVDRLAGGGRREPRLVGDGYPSPVKREACVPERMSASS